jgi:hypothetical protein
MSSTQTVPLLHYAVPRDYQHRYYPVPDPRIVEILLADGESPNAVHADITPWQQALAYARGQQNRSDTWHERLKILQIITLMLNAGADSRTTVPIVSDFFSATAYSIEHLLADITKESNRLGCHIGDAEDSIVDEFLEASRHALENSSVPSPNPTSSAVSIRSTDPELLNFKPSKRTRVRTWIKLQILRK